MENFIEKDCCVKHEGQSFCNGGAMVTDDYLIGYAKDAETFGKPGTVTDWHGNPIGTFEVTGRWRIPNGWVASHMHSYRVTLHDGQQYNCRGCGDGMVLRGKRRRVA